MSKINRREALEIFGFGLAGGLMTRSAASRENAAFSKPPNMIVVFADDLGYGDLGCYGAGKIRTPNLDRMAREGMRFTDFYCSAAVCSPSRAGLLTGRYHVRMGINSVFFPNSRDGLDSADICMAQMLKDLGYATACIGKWHLGHCPNTCPRAMDLIITGLPYSNDMNVEKRGDPPVPLMRGKRLLSVPQTERLRGDTRKRPSVYNEHHDRSFPLFAP